MAEKYNKLFRFDGHIKDMLDELSLIFHKKEKRVVSQTKIVQRAIEELYEIESKKINKVIRKDR